MTPRPLPLLLLAACTGRTADDSTPPEPPATAHWMADVLADRPEVPLGRVLIPGAFNSSSCACDAANGISPDSPAAVLGLWGTGAAAPDDPNRQRVVDRARTQDLSLSQQLLTGARFVELNVTLKEGVVTTWHSVYGVPLGEVLDQAVHFAAAWPDEVVVTFGVSLDAADWPLLADDLTAPRDVGPSFCDLVYDGEQDAALTTLAEVRASGRDLVGSPGGELRAFLESRGDCPLSRGATDRVWSIIDDTEGVEAALQASVDSRDVGRLLVDDFVSSLDGADGVLAQAACISEYAGVREVSEALGFAGDFPGRLIEAYDAQGNMNILAGACLQDNDLVEAAIEANRRR